jgi:hypothetical protein
MNNERQNAKRGGPIARKRMNDEASPWKKTVKMRERKDPERARNALRIPTIEPRS